MSGCPILRLIAVVAHSEYSMENITHLVCFGQDPGSNKYYLGRTGTLVINNSNSDMCPEGCGGSSAGSGTSSSWELLSPFIGPKGGIYVNYTRGEIWIQDGHSATTYTSGFDPESYCDCTVNGTFKQQVEDLVQLQWKQNGNAPGGMELTSPTNGNKLTCTKSVQYLNTCGGGSGYTYADAEGNDCLSDAWATFSTCGFCSGGGEGDEQRFSRGCSWGTYRNICKQLPGQELTQAYVFGLVEGSATKILRYLSELPDSVPNQNRTAQVLNRAKWSYIADKCGGSIAFNHKHTPKYYGAKKTILKLRVIDDNLFSEHPEARARALKNNSTGEIKFIDTSNNFVVSTLPFALSGGRIDLSSISNTDEQFAPRESGQERQFNVQIVLKDIIFAI